MLQKNVAPGIHRIEDAYTNWYLIEDAGRFTVVDCGVRSSWKSFQEALATLGASTDQIDGVVLTHAHFDHIGFAERLRRTAGVDVWVHQNDVPLTKHPMQYAHADSRIPLLKNFAAAPILGSLLAARAFWPTPIKEVKHLPTSTLDLPGSPDVIFTPGHTLGHCILNLPDRNAAIVGDALVTLDPYTARRGPRLVAGAATADHERALGSLSAIADTGAQILLTGHGEPWTEGAGAAVRAARAAADGDR